MFIFFNEILKKSASALNRSKMSALWKHMMVFVYHTKLKMNMASDMLCEITGRVLRHH